MTYTFEMYQEAAQYILERTTLRPKVAITLGSGLAPLAEAVQAEQVFPYADIPHFPRATVEGHPGRMIVGTLEGTPVVVMQGRVHFYEGYTLQEVTFYVRVLKLMGVETLILTNAAGGLNKAFHVGDLMLIEDHINLPGLVGHSPLWGPNDERFGPRFPPMNRAYTRALRELAFQVARELDVDLRRGVYVGLGGPAFETPAEVRMLRALGGDAVGMSTVHETVVAVHAGMQVLGISTITNIAVDRVDAAEEASHEEVLEAGKKVAPRLAALIQGIVQRIG
ncbi:MAG: purine-nucleoside phosphorylase [Chloroflexi bacterium]|nr:purine-nucleoside phosphorylase [Chloroflexota bacterium]